MSYNNLIFHSTTKLSEKYNYFLCGIIDSEIYDKYNVFGNLSNDLSYICPEKISKHRIKTNLFVNMKVEYKKLTAGKFQKTNHRYSKEFQNLYITGYGIIVTGTDLLVLDIDYEKQYYELLELCPNIITDCKFKRINIDSAHRMHLYYKKPSGFETSGIIRRIKLKTTQLWICGLNKKQIPFAVDTAHIFRDENYKYDLIGHMDDITECPQVIIDKIIEDENNAKMSST